MHDPNIKFRKLPTGPISLSPALQQETPLHPMLKSSVTLSRMTENRIWVPLSNLDLTEKSFPPGGNYAHIYEHTLAGAKKGLLQPVSWLMMTASLPWKNVSKKFTSTSGCGSAKRQAKINLVKYAIFLWSLQFQVCDRSVLPYVGPVTSERKWKVLRATWLKQSPLTWSLFMRWCFLLLLLLLLLLRVIPRWCFLMIHHNVEDIMNIWMEAQAWKN